MNYYERHLGDYAKDTAHLTMLEHGAYGLLLDRYYGTEQGIQADQAHRVARARSKEEKAAVDAVLAEFFTLADGVWSHSRVEREIEKAQTKIKAARENGQRGGRPKKNPATTEEKPSGFPVGSENGTETKALQTPDTRHQEEPKGSSPAVAVPSPAPAAPLKAKDLQAQGIDPQHAADWLALRKAKRLPLTPTAWADTVAEGRKAGMSPAQTVATAVANNWAGFKVKWLADKPNGTHTTAAERRVLEAAPGIAASHLLPAAPWTTIDMEATNVTPIRLG